MWVNIVNGIAVWSVIAFVVVLFIKGASCNSGTHECYGCKQEA